MIRATQPASAPLVPAQAGTQKHTPQVQVLDSRLRGNERLDALAT
jgi:hypothetical protein